MKIIQTYSLKTKKLREKLILIFLLCFFNISAFSQLLNSHLFPVRIDGKWGYINVKGELEIEANYELAFPFSDGYAVVQEDGVLAIINSKGESIFVPGDGYSIDDEVIDGMLIYSTIHGESFYNIKSGEFLPEKYDRVEPFSEGLAKFRDKVTKRYGFINKEGEIVIQPHYESCGSFKNELCAVRYNNKWAFINKEGRLTCLNIYTFAKDYSDDLAPVWKFTNNIEYINKENEVVFTHRIYEDVNKLPSTFNPPFYSFSNGMVKVVDYNSGYFGYKNTKGEQAIRYQYTEAGDFHSGLARVKYGEKWGMIDKKGGFKINAQYDYIEDFDHGLARVYKGGDAEDFNENAEGVSMGYINKKGVLIWGYTR